MPRTRYDDDEYADDAPVAGSSCGAGGSSNQSSCGPGGCGASRGGPLSDRDLPQEIDMDEDDDDISEAPSEECDRCGREYYGEFCPACGPESGPKEMPNSWIRILGLIIVFAFVIATLSLLR